MEEIADVVREQLLGRNAVLVWVDPISDGRRRDALSELLRDGVGKGLLESPHSVWREKRRQNHDDFWADCRTTGLGEHKRESCR